MNYRGRYILLLHVSGIHSGVGTELPLATLGVLLIQIHLTAMKYVHLG